MTARVFHVGGLQELFKQTVGVSTGLACGAQIANCFLHTLDSSIKASFSADVVLYKRYIDDILLVTHTPVLHAVMLVLNSFDPRIKVTHDDSESASGTSFLDIYICISSKSTLSYRTYHKPLCMYDYLPFASCHDRISRTGIFKGELIRLLRTNLHEDDFFRETCFTFQKPIDRGYDRETLRKIRSSITWHNKSSHLSQQGRKKPHVVPFKMKYSDAAANMRIAEILNMNMHLLPSKFIAKNRIVLCYCSNRSLFRLRYHRFLE